MNFSYPAQRQLRRRLGELGAFVELNELALRSFATAAESFTTVPSDRETPIEQFVKKSCDEHGVRVRVRTLDGLNTRAAQSYLLLVSAEVEMFVHALKEEHEYFGAKWVARNSNDKKEALLEWAVRAVNASANDPGLRVDNKSLALTVATYFLILRNAVVHRELQKGGRLRREYATISEMSDDIKTRYNLLPNPLERVSFDDFVLFSRAARDLSDEMARAVKPTEEQVGIVAKAAVRKMSNRATRANRIDQAAASKLATDYGLDLATADRIVKATHGLGG